MSNTLVSGALNTDEKFTDSQVTPELREAGLAYLATAALYARTQTRVAESILSDLSGRHLLVHALAAGGLPLAVAGLGTGNPVAVVTWTAVGAASHYAVDWTHKFGLQQVALAVVLDQACHLLTILVLVLTIGSPCP